MSESLTGEIKSTKRLFDGVVFNVDEVQIELTQKKDGRIVKEMEITRQLVTKRPCVVALVKHQANGKFLLAKEYRVGARREEYGFVAGIIDEGETSWDAVIRETQEEIGYKPTLVKEIGSSFSSSGFTNEHITYFYVEVNENGKVKRKLDADEAIIVDEFSLERIRDLIKWGDMNSNHAKACLLHYLLDENIN